jgi:hypothetical protein
MGLSDPDQLALFADLRRKWTAPPRVVVPPPPPSLAAQELFTEIERLARNESGRAN